MKRKMNMKMKAFYAVRFRELRDFYKNCEFSLAFDMEREIQAYSRALAHAGIITREVEKKISNVAMEMAISGKYIKPDKAA